MLNIERKMLAWERRWEKAMLWAWDWPAEDISGGFFGRLGV